MITLRRRNISRILLIIFLAITYRLFFASSPSKSNEIQPRDVLDYVSRDDKLDMRRYKWLHSRVGRDERPDIMTDIVTNGVDDFWRRYQRPYITGKDTSNMDAQNVVTSIEQLLSLNGWVAALCPTLTRPFDTDDSAYDELARQGNLYYVAIVIHSADHFLVDQLAVIVQLAKRLGPSNVFVSMLDYDSTDSTETLTDLSEAVLILLGVPYRIRRVPGMTVEPTEAYYPLEEAYTRNLALEPLHELYERRKIQFHRVLWLKGFTCPNDILETIKVSQATDAAMVCGMDWAEHNGFFIFSDRWRTRDINGDQFRQSKSSSKPDAVPPRDKIGAARYSQHLPFQVFCCEAGTHVVDPVQSYYQGIAYRAGSDFHNTSSHETAPVRPSDAPCLDSSQAWFCRDLWLHKAREVMSEVDANGDYTGHRSRRRKRQVADGVLRKDAHRQAAAGDPDANAGSDYDAMPDSDADLSLDSVSPVKLSIPNSAFRPARILVNPRCVTTYAGVSHTQLARDLFGEDERGGDSRSTAHDAGKGAKYVLEDWEGAPESFVCQEQRNTGGRKATKTQRRLGFSIHEELQDRPFTGA